MHRRKNAVIETCQAFKAQLDDIRQTQRAHANEVHEWFKLNQQKLVIDGNSAIDTRSPAYKKLKSSTKHTTQSPGVTELIKKEIRAMKKKELQSALRARNIDDTGLKPELQRRLLEARKQDLQLDVPEVTVEKKEPYENDVDPDPSPLMAKPQMSRIDKSKPVQQNAPYIGPDLMDISQERRKFSEAKSDAKSSVTGKGTVRSPVVNIPSPRSSVSAKQGSFVSAKKSVFEGKASPFKSTHSAIKRLPSPRTSPIRMRSPFLRGDPAIASTAVGSSGLKAFPSKPFASNEKTSAPSTTSSEGSSLLSLSVKEKTSARVARVKEMREKSKPLNVNKALTTPQQYTPSLPSLSKGSTHASTERKRLLAAKMRAKTNTTFQKHLPTTSESVVRAPKPLAISRAPMQKNVSSKFHVSSALPMRTHKTTENVKIEPVAVLEPPESPLSTYEMSENEEDGSDESMSDSEDEEERAKKPIPRWAKRENLNPCLEKQFKAERLDPDQIFGEVATCDLAAIFDADKDREKKERYRKRTSSGNWRFDRATTTEKQDYRRIMHYNVSAVPV